MLESTVPFPPGTMSGASKATKSCRLVVSKWCPESPRVKGGVKGSLKGGVEGCVEGGGGKGWSGIWS